MKYNIREIKEKDNKQVEHVIRTCLIEFGGNHEGLAWSDPDLARFSEVYNKTGFKYWVVENEKGTVVGGCGIGKLEGIDDVCELQKMYCLKEARGTGVAHDLMKLALDYAKKYAEDNVLLDEDLGASLDDFDIVPSEETTIEALKQYMGEDVMFYTVSGIDLLDDGMSIDISDLGEEFVGTLYLYYYDETNGLQLVSNPNNASLTFDKNGTYVLSATNLIPSTPSEETPSEEVPEVPQTFDALGVYAGIGLVSAAGIAGAVIYLKRRNA